MVNLRTLAGPTTRPLRRPPPLPSGCTLPPLPALKGSAPVNAGAKLKRSQLAVGLKLALTCNLASTATAKLTLSKTVAKSVGLSASIPIGSGTAKCNADGKSLKLKLTAKAATKLKGHKVAATLTVLFKRPGSNTFKFARAVKIV